MKTVKTEGKELRYWDFGAVEVKNEAGEVTSKSGDWVRKPVSVEVQAPESLDEALAVSEQNETRLCELVTKGLQFESAERSGIAPEGTFSKGMVSAAVKALKPSPQFKDLKRKELATAVMKFVGSNEGIKTGFAMAFEGLRTAQVEEEEEE